MIKRPKRPRDPAQLAKLIADIAPGAVQDATESDKKKARSVRILIPRSW
jgi:hypothetical protein